MMGLLVLILLTVFLTSGFFILLAWWFVDRPLRDLTRIILSAPSRDFLVRAPIHGSGVVGRLAGSFNRLLERITTLDAFKMETERQLIVAQEELKNKEAVGEKKKINQAANQGLEVRFNGLPLLYDFPREISMAPELDEL